MPFFSSLLLAHLSRFAAPDILTVNVGEGLEPKDILIGETPITKHQTSCYCD